MSVGFGGVSSDAAVVPAFSHQFPDVHDGDHVNPFVDFALFSDSSQGDEFFGTSFEDRTEAGNWLQGPPQDPYEYVDVSQFFDVHAGSGATTSVSDESGTVALEAEHRVLSV